MRKFQVESNSRGFTIIELLLIMGITAILLGFITVNLIGVQKRSTLSSDAQVLVSDLRSQQLKAMKGVSVTTTGDEDFGITFGSNGYTLFHGTHLNNDSSDFTVSFGNPVVLTASPSDKIVFTKLTGEVGTTYTIKLTDSGSGQQKIITVNPLGVVVSGN